MLRSVPPPIAVLQHLWCQTANQLIIAAEGWSFDLNSYFGVCSRSERMESQKDRGSSSPERDPLGSGWAVWLIKVAQQHTLGKNPSDQKDLSAILQMKVCNDSGGGSTWGFVRHNSQLLLFSNSKRLLLKQTRHPPAPPACFLSTPESLLTRRPGNTRIT